MELSSSTLKTFLPDHPQKTYITVGRCIYCGSINDLRDEHIIPLGLGGRMVISKSSCSACEGISSAFEGMCLRTMFGPLRMLYDLPSRRKKDRPQKLPLKVKFNPGEEWTNILVNQEDYPFLVLFPNFQLPDLLSGNKSIHRGAVTDKFWIRGASASQGFFNHMDNLIASLGVREVMPEAKAHVEEFCLMLAKIGHSYATVEIGHGGFKPLLLNLILQRDLSNTVDYIGGLSQAENPSLELHELSICDQEFNRPDLVVVRIRLFAKLGTPTYYVVAGRYFKH